MTSCCLETAPIRERERERVRARARERERESERERKKERKSVCMIYVEERGITLTCMTGGLGLGFRF
jgi:hypothetical protein